MKSTTIVAAMYSGRGGYRGRGRGGRGGRGGFDRSSSWKDDGSSTRPYCKVCFHNHEEGQCHHTRVECYGCHKTGHIQRNCPESRSPAPQSEGERKQIIGMIRNTIAQFSPIGDTEFAGWILDSGCTTHICNNRSRFIDSTYKEHTEAVQTATGQIVMSCGKGSIAINLAVTGVELLLKEVIHVPEVEHNYMSMNALSKRKLDVFFHHVQPRLMINNNVIGYIDKLIDCYELYGIREEGQKVMALIKKSPDSAVWHGRTAHLGHRNMLKMRSLVKGMEELKMSSPPEEICGFCMIGRQQAEISRSPMTRATKLLELLHLDLEGPLPTAWIGGYSYFLLIKDDFSLLTFVYPLKLKSEAHHKLIEFKTLMEKQINMEVKRLRVDGGGEFRGHKWEDWCKETGIKLEPSAPYTPQQNGKAERSMYTLMAPVRSILKEKKLSKALWAELVKAVAYVKNRCPGVDGVTSFQTGNGFQPDVSNLRALGCRAWVHVPKTTGRHKLDSRSWQGIMVGYEGVNQWRIYNPVNRKIHVSRDVKFDELNIYDGSIDFNDNEEGQIWNEEDDSLFDDTVRTTVDDLTSESSLGESRYPTPISDDAAALVGAEASEDVEEEKDNEEDLLLHTFEPPEHVIPQGVMRPPTDRSVSKATKEFFRTAQEQQEEQEEVRAQPKSKEKKAVPASTRVTRSSKSDVRPDYKKLNEGSSANRVSVILTEPEALIPTFRSGKVAKSHVHMMRVLHALTSDETLGLGLAHEEPKTYKEARASSDWPLWMKAMKAEVDSLIENETWELVTSPNDRSKSLTGRWVFKIKYGLDGNILKYKARWVVHGYKQQYGIDYNETWSGVVKSATFRMMFGIAATRDLHIEQMDVVTAFLYGFLDELVYVEQPHGFVIDPGLVCKLRKALYGLKQAPRVWSAMIRSFLNKLGFHETESDKSLFVSEDKKMFIAVYVDDLLIIGADMSRIDKVKAELKSTFKMTDLGPASHYLGMEIRRDRGRRTLTLLQTTYLETVLEKFGMRDCASVATPMEASVPNSVLPSTEQADEDTVYWYGASVGSLMYAMVTTRPDIAFALSVASRYCSNPNQAHVALVTRIFKYIKGTLKVGITFGGSTELEVVGYSDADYNGAVDGRCSTGAWLFLLAGGPISWSAKRQATPAMSTCEAEYMALSETGKEALWLRYIMVDLGLLSSEVPTLVWADNKGAIALGENPEFHRKTKHIESKWHWIRSFIERGILLVKFIPTASMAADGLTKALTPKAFRDFRSMMGM